MTQPLITTEQIDNDSLFPVESGIQVQTQNGVISPTNGTTNIPFDATTPLYTEGSEIGSAPFTRQFSTSKVLINFSLTIDASANGTNVVIAVFRNQKCIASSVVTIANAGNPVTVSMVHVDEPNLGSPGLEDPITYSGRVGYDTGSTGTWYVNSTSSGDDMGGTLHTHFVLTELK